MTDEHLKQYLAKVWLEDKLLEKKSEYIFFQSRIMQVFLTR